MRHTCLCMLTALGGALVGATVAMLVTPQSGRELRGKIREAYNEATERLHACDCSDPNCECHK